MFDKSAIEALKADTAPTAAMEAINDALDMGRGIIALHEKVTLQDLEKYLPAPRHQRGAMRTSNLESARASPV